MLQANSPTSSQIISNRSSLQAATSVLLSFLVYVVYTIGKQQKGFPRNLQAFANRCRTPWELQKAPQGPHMDRLGPPGTLQGRLRSAQRRSMHAQGPPQVAPRHNKEFPKGFPGARSGGIGSKINVFFQCSSTHPRNSLEGPWGSLVHSWGARECPREAQETPGNSWGPGGGPVGL